jgi:hypothetical protein
VSYGWLIMSLRPKNGSRSHLLTACLNLHIRRRSRRGRRSWQGAGTGANTEIKEKIGEDMVLSNRDKAQHSDIRGMDGNTFRPSNCRITRQIVSRTTKPNKICWLVETAAQRSTSWIGMDSSQRRASQGRQQGAFRFPRGWQPYAAKRLSRRISEIPKLSLANGPKSVH